MASGTSVSGEIDLRSKARRPILADALTELTLQMLWKTDAQVYVLNIAFFTSATLAREVHHHQKWRSAISRRSLIDHVANYRPGESGEFFVPPAL